jgi:methylenetetrahydrofolate--tRNA-(uracil-5-)-methyltransferase
MNRMFRASRYDKGEADFLNLPLNRQQYEEFVAELVKAETVELKDFEKGLFFEACLPIEEIARRGFQSLAFGPLKPVGLLDPARGEIPHAVIQLRQDDLKSQFYQLVGFQTRLKWGEQKRIFRMLPGLEEAQFERYGRMHRNSYISAPLILNKFYQTKFKENLFFAGQISGVEGYVEAIGSGLAAGIFAAKRALAEPLYNFPEETANGALIHYITQANWKDFRPTRFTFGLLPDLPDRYKSRKARGKKIKKEMKARIALEALHKWLEKAGI